jgi:DNA-binding transcriptional LysR family regulator
MALSWDQLRSFLAALDEASLSAAARRLGLTQPTLGRHIDELEQRLGIVLFTRSPTGLVPTAAALELRPHAETMAAAADALVRAASGEAEADRGTVRLTASEIVGCEVLPPILASLQQTHPGIAVELVVSNHNDDLLRREADIAVRMVRPGQGTLLARRIGEIEVGFHAHPDYLRRRGIPASLADLTDHAVIGFDREPGVVQALRRLGVDLDPASFSLRTDNDVAQLAAIRAGFGIGACQVQLAQRQPELVRVLPESFSYPLDCWMVMHEDFRNVRRMRVVFDHVAEALVAYRSGQ